MAKEHRKETRFWIKVKRGGAWREIARKDYIMVKRSLGLLKRKKLNTDDFSVGKVSGIVTIDGETPK